MAVGRLNALAAALGLGPVTAPPRSLTGGLMHRVWRVETRGGSYAVKALNPELAARPGALDSIRASERIAAAFAQRGFPAVAALEIAGEALHALDERWFIVYPWVRGRSAFPPQISAGHCAAVGGLLGRLHAAALSLPGLAPQASAPAELDWTAPLAAPTPRQEPWRQRLSAALDDLARWSGEALEASARLSETQVISHRDLDPKNVLWQGLAPSVIDWEAAGFIHPRQELLEALLYWADDARGGLDRCRAGALLSAYRRHMPTESADWSAVFSAGRLSTLEWLHYNARRAAGLLPGGPHEIQRGADETLKALDALYGYAARIGALKPLLNA